MRGLWWEDLGVYWPLMLACSFSLDLSGFPPNFFLFCLPCSSHWMQVLARWVYSQWSHSFVVKEGSKRGIKDVPHSSPQKQEILEIKGIKESATWWWLKYFLLILKTVLYSNVNCLSRVFASHHYVLINQKRITFPVFHRHFWIPAVPQAMCGMLEGQGKK